jgi:hypothetical protein
MTSMISTSSWNGSPPIETRYNQAAKPFKWKFTTTDLADLMDRLDRHRPTISTDPAQPRAAW